MNYVKWLRRAGLFLLMALLIFIAWFGHRFLDPFDRMVLVSQSLQKASDGSFYLEREFEVRKEWSYEVVVRFSRDQIVRDSEVSSRKLDEHAGYVDFELYEKKQSNLPTLVSSSSNHLIRISGRSTLSLSNTFAYCKLHPGIYKLKIRVFNINEPLNRSQVGLYFGAPDLLKFGYNPSTGVIPRCRYS
ncbi:hypothetical protein NQT62_11685 [Limnobacter humi]|uniref:DUF5625 domain-containing protein n=1 Tax=Limnobacter humi TaxID=1778671 RepID=A0ABT1WHW3_9BURK|nr:hypothetical protein [Limnobacter humi]MCQ8897095.1 hypothetical protein [Limnobacter humi]